MLQQEQLNELIQRSQRGETTLEEETLLLEWIDADPQNLALLARTKNLDLLIQEWVAYEQVSTEEAKEKVWTRWQQEKNKPRVMRWIKYAAAAAVVITGATIMYKSIIRPPAQQQQAPKMVQVDSTQAPKPGSDKAILHLANDRHHIIKDTAMEYLATLDNLRFSRAHGAVYCTALPGMVAPRAIRYYTLETPRGGRYQLVLPDGTKVWLNAASKIQFQNIDTGNKRIVQLEGEAYFEVAKNSRKPFIVKVNGADVKVTGTHFNISSYPDEHLSRATLIEGHISVNTGGMNKLMVPNYSAIFSYGSKPRVEREANMARITAWKDQQFLWKGDSLTAALREIERWYDVTVQYKGEPPATVISQVRDSRAISLHDIMDLVTTSEGDTAAYFELKGRSLIVSKNRLH